ncbi:hypothetical protein PULV_a0185 [Pseudoalteromonas ulvae UL12]|uniref:Orphan protein n=1 Tax=Pseudoalteromonas ulvae TaxID=107327 RepID=A0A244CUV3_PSEDV|nr:hypothetical protein [Pseudoalteromonas ulvae]MBE0362650.1 hypothetical protein [Pseudoalteromonas ulvae UL12]OUL59400.1 hypothetical protein B1199_03780 [Pseudoalteromonas ulvae]
MSNKIKQQKLLSPEQLKKQQAQRKQQKLKHANQSQSNTLKPTNQIETKKRNWLPTIIISALLGICILLAPKPALLTYQKSGVTTQSIYWPGIFNTDAQLLDSHLLATLDNQEKNLFICHNQTDISGCQKYQVIEKSGPISAAIFYLSHKKN